MIIVTGGAGFIGSALVHKLNELGEEDIVIIDDFEQGDKWLNLRGLKYEKFLNISEFYLNEEHWGKVRNADAIFHMGACSSTTEADMDFLHENNFVCSKRLFLFATERNIPFFYASSAATYGAGKRGYSDDEGSIKNLRPLNKYGYSKQIFDEWVLKQKNKPDCWFGFKFFNVFGPNEYHKEGMFSVAYKAFHQIKSEKKVKLFKSHRSDFKDGEQKRDFIYVKDVVNAMLEIHKRSQEDELQNGIYNLGTGKARSFNDLAKACFTSLGVEPNIEYIDMPENIKGQYQYFTEAEMGKFFKLLPNFEFTSLEDGVADYMKNYLDTDNPNLETCNNEV